MLLNILAKLSVQVKIYMKRNLKDFLKKCMLMFGLFQNPDYAEWV